MKKKLLVLGMAGVLLFSGLSVSAAVNDECGHPSRTEYVGTETKYPAKCPEEEDCTVYYLYRVDTVVCNNCHKVISELRTHIGYKHVKN